MAGITDLAQMLGSLKPTARDGGMGSACRRLAAPGKRRNPGSQADIWMIVDIYLVQDEVDVHKSPKLPPPVTSAPVAPADRARAAGAAGAFGAGGAPASIDGACGPRTPFGTPAMGPVGPQAPNPACFMDHDRSRCHTVKAATIVRRRAVPVRC